METHRLDCASPLQISIYRSLPSTLGIQTIGREWHTFHTCAPSKEDYLLHSYVMLSPAFVMSQNVWNRCTRATSSAEEVKEHSGVSESKKNCRRKGIESLTSFMASYAGDTPPMSVIRLAKFK